MISHQSSAHDGLAEALLICEDAAAEAGLGSSLARSHEMQRLALVVVESDGDPLRLVCQRQVGARVDAVQKVTGHEIGLHGDCPLLVLAFTSAGTGRMLALRPDRTAGA